MLEVSGLEAGYGDGRVLFGVDLAVMAGEVVTLLGRNGMGKTTTLAAVIGILPALGVRWAICNDSGIGPQDGIAGDATVDG